MPRIRTIKPDFFRSRTVETLTLEQRLTFIGLWTHVDDEGRCKYDPRLIKIDIWGLSDRTDAEIETDIRALTEASLITHYVVGEDSYLSVCGFREHQTVNRPSPSHLPSPEMGEIQPVPSGNGDPPAQVHESSPDTHVPLTEDSSPERKGKERKRRGTPPRHPGSTSLRPDVDQLCEQLQAKITANGSKAPAITERWRTEARLLIDRDGRELSEALELISWSQDHHFWRSNILSLPKFREKFDQLRLQRQQANGAERRDQGTGRAVDISW